MTLECHGLEQHEDGTASFVSDRDDAWHRLGTTVKGTLTADQVLELAYLKNWNVRKSPMYTSSITGDGVSTVEVPGRYASIRDNPKTKNQIDVLGVVGEIWTPFQNEAQVEVLEAMRQESGGRFATAGSLFGGKHTFVSIKLPDVINVGGVDRVDLYAMAWNSFTGKSSVKLSAGAVRPLCANTVEMHFASAVSVVPVRHTADVAQRMEEARKALSMTLGFAKKFDAEAERMLATAMSEAQFNKILDEWIKPTEEKASPSVRTRRVEKIRTMNWLFTEAPTQAPIRGTRWAALQAIGEYVDHYAPVATKKGDENEIRATRALSRKGREQKTYAFNTLRVPAKA